MLEERNSYHHGASESQHCRRVHSNQDACRYARRENHQQAALRGRERQGASWERSGTHFTADSQKVV